MGSGINLFVAQLDKRIDENFLKQEFEKFGDVLSTYVIRDENGLSKGYGFVHFSSMVSGQRAMMEMDRKVLFSRDIRVLVANKKEEGKGYDRSKSTVWTSEWTIPRTDAHFSCDSTSESSYSIEDKPGNAEVSCVKQRMSKLLEEQLYTDVFFYQKKSRKSSISAHKAVLAVGSPLFAKMLFDDNKDTAGMKMEVQISNIPFDAFSNIVKYLYTDDIFFESDSQVQDILVGAKQFQIQSLVDRCNSYFENQELTEQNVCFKLQMSIANKMDALKNRCLNYIQENTLQVIHSSDFLKCSSSTVSRICKLQSFNLRSEAELLKVIMKWLQDQPLYNRRQLLEPILKNIRFLNLTATELSDVMMTYPDLLSSDDGLQIMLYLHTTPETRNFKDLPSWCNKSTVNRCIVGNPRMGNYPRDLQVGKVILPLKPSLQGYVTELTSLLQMQCVKGHHQINAIKLSFQGPVSNRSIIKSIAIILHVTPSNFRYREDIEIANSLEIRVPLNKPVRARRGDLVHIEVEARDIQFYKFLQFDDTLSVPSNPHFQCYVSSRPKLGKLYFISEVEYGPEDQKDVEAKNKRRQKRGMSRFQSRNRL